MLLLALIAISSAAPVLRMMAAVPPLLRASWRQQLTTLLVLPAAAFELRALPAASRRRLCSTGVLLRLLGAGLLLGADFGLWIWSLDTTTIAHSVLLLSSCPILLAVGRVVCRLPISAHEVAGALLGFGGVALSMGGELFAVRTDTKAAAFASEAVSLRGDVAAICGAAAFVGYLLLGQEMRQWMPTFVYVAPVFGISALFLTLASIVVEGAALPAGFGGGSPASAEASVFGWAGGEWLWLTVYLGVFPGVCGHASITMCVAHLDPLVISVALLLEPIVSATLGYALGVSDMPDGWTLAGGPLLLAGCALTIHAQGQRERFAIADASKDAGAGAGDGEAPSRHHAREGAMRLEGDDNNDDDDDKRKAGDGRTASAAHKTGMRCFASHRCLSKKDADSQAVLELM
jgi:drug/metabolite transporter (DMT)-like permease